MTITLTLNSYNLAHTLQQTIDTLQGIGEPILTLSSTLSDNEIWLEGAIVSRTTYAALFAVYGTTYGSGDGSTTFALPNFSNRAIWGGSSFGYIDAGLPNIYGELGWYDGGANSPNAYQSGALYCSQTTTAHGRSTTNSTHGIMDFDASRSNGIYGASSTVQPPSIRVRVKTKYA